MPATAPAVACHQLTPWRAVRPATRIRSPAPRRASDAIALFDAACSLHLPRLTLIAPPQETRWGGDDEGGRRKGGCHSVPSNGRRKARCDRVRHRSAHWRKWSTNTRIPLAPNRRLRLPRLAAGPAAPLHSADVLLDSLPRSAPVAGQTPSPSSYQGWIHARLMDHSPPRRCRLSPNARLAALSNPITRF